ncbi:uncharacterized protein BX664DRAFT_320354, partial [Halteromyces radiatus]|uniref:uncharacterized protein n=1 Tax=Halteromyces radiatus TaxID=101107 RepID=UPI00221FBCB3
MYHHHHRLDTLDTYSCRQPLTQTDHDDKNNTHSRLKQVVLYKTEICRNWAELGHCRYGIKCRYAHGDAELRQAPRHTLYKTKICRAYHDQGECPYGIRCTFIHDDNQKIQPAKSIEEEEDYY